jgi:hypothetical protein
LYLDSIIYISMSAKYSVKEKKDSLNEQPVCNREKQGEVNFESSGTEISGHQAQSILPFKSAPIRRVSP